MENLKRQLSIINLNHHHTNTSSSTSSGGTGTGTKKIKFENLTNLEIIENPLNNNLNYEKFKNFRIPPPPPQPLQQPPPQSHPTPTPMSKKVSPPKTPNTKPKLNLNTVGTGTDINGGSKGHNFSNSPITPSINSFPSNRYNILPTPQTTPKWKSNSVFMNHQNHNPGTDRFETDRFETDHFDTDHDTDTDAGKLIKKSSIDFRKLVKTNSLISLSSSIKSLKTSISNTSIKYSLSPSKITTGATTTNITSTSTTKPKRSKFHKFLKFYKLLKSNATQSITTTSISTTNTHIHTDSQSSGEDVFINSWSEFENKLDDLNTINSSDDISPSIRYLLNCDNIDLSEIELENVVELFNKNL